MESRHTAAHFLLIMLTTVTSVAQESASHSCIFPSVYAATRAMTCVSPASNGALRDARLPVFARDGVSGWWARAWAGSSRGRTHTL